MAKILMVRRGRVGRFKLIYSIRDAIEYLESGDGHPVCIRVMDSRSHIKAFDRLKREAKKGKGWTRTLR